MFSPRVSVWIARETKGGRVFAQSNGTGQRKVWKGRSVSRDAADINIHLTKPPIRSKSPSTYIVRTRENTYTVAPKTGLPARRKSPSLNMQRQFNFLIDPRASKICYRDSRTVSGNFSGKCFWRVPYGWSFLFATFSALFDWSGLKGSGIFWIKFRHYSGNSKNMEPDEIHNFIEYRAKQK